MYSMYETLARDRIAERQQQAAQTRLARQVASARWWERLSTYAANRAATSQGEVLVASASEFQLVA